MLTNRIDRKDSGFVLLTALMLLILFTGASITTLYSVTASIKGTGYMLHRIKTFEWADGGLRTVFSDMCDHTLTQETSDADLMYEKPKSSGLQYTAELQDLRVVKRRVPGFSQELLGRDILIKARGWDHVTGKPGSIGEMLVFIARTQVAGGYGNE